MNCSVFTHTRCIFENLPFFFWKALFIVTLQPRVMHTHRHRDSQLNHKNAIFLWTLSSKNIDLSYLS